MPIDLDHQSEMLIAKIKHYLITNMGRVSDEANIEELYRALCYSLREEIMIHWLATARTQVQTDARMLYYLSMEYLPGRILTNNISNLQSNTVVRLVLTKLKRNFSDIVIVKRTQALATAV